MFFNFEYYKYNFRYLLLTIVTALMFNVYLSIGGNLGDRLANLRKCIGLLEDRVGLILKKSSVYETKAWGNEDQPDFYNMVLLIETNYSPFDLLKQSQHIELELGRERVKHWGERTIDIDILFFDEQIVKTKELVVPHPFIQDRMFVLEPLNEISPKFIHPILKKSVEVIYKECKDSLPVRKLNELL